MILDKDAGRRPVGNAAPLLSAGPNRGEGPAKNGEIVRSTLCEAQSGFVYKLVIRSSTGKITNVIVDAKTPF